MAIINGTDGNDSIKAEYYNDLIYGYDGNDTINGDYGNDTMYGNGGNDYIYATYGDDLVYGGDGNDTINTSEGYDTIYGENGDDYISGSNFDYCKGNSFLSGGDGNDTISGRNYLDTIIGGIGNDVLYGYNGNDAYIFNLGDGQDTINDSRDTDLIQFDEGITINNLTYARSGNNLIIKYSETDQITIINHYYSSSNKIESIKFSDQSTLSLNNLIAGTSNNDTLTGTSSSELIYGYEGNDKIYTGYGNDLVYGGIGNDSIWGDYGQDTIYGEAGNDYIVGSSNGNNFISGGDGNDSINGGSYHDTINGDTGDDTLNGGYGNDSINGGLGNDYIQGAYDNDIIYGNEGNDIIFGGSGQDTIYGDEGNDSINGNDGNDVIYGEDGNDTLKGDTGNDTYIFNLGDGQDTIYDSSGYDLIQFGNSININDLTFTNSENNLIIKYSETDQITQTTNQYLSSAKVETIKFNDGSTFNLNNLYLGTADDDTYTIDDSSATILENSNAGTDTVIALDSYILPDNVENLTLTGYQRDEEWGNYLDWYQGDNSKRKPGTCLYVSLENLLIQAGIFEPKTDYNPPSSGIDELESFVLNLADSYMKGIQNYQEENIMQIFEKAVSQLNTLYATESYDSQFLQVENVTLEEMAYYIEEGYCVAALCDANVLWSLSEYWYTTINHAITITDADSNGFYICDSGRRLESDAARYITYNEMWNSFYYGSDDYGNYYGTIIRTIDPVKQSLDNINGTGNDLNNKLVGNSGQNILYGMAGNDTLNGAGGADTLYGGTGDDTYYINSRDTIIELENEGIDTVMTLTNDTYFLGENIENASIESTRGVRINGNSLDNLIEGSSFNDTIYGDSGNDTLDGGKGKNTLIGGIGDDTYCISKIGDIILENINEGIDTINSSIIYILKNKNIENLTLTGTANIKGTGNVLNNTITGNSGNNLLSGGAGNDTYIFDSGHGRDSITDSSGNDSIILGDLVHKDDIALFKDRRNKLFIDYGSSVGTDTITINSWNKLTAQIEKIELNDGSFITNTEINQILQTMTAYAASNQVVMGNVQDVKNNQELMNIIASSWHS